MRGLSGQNKGQSVFRILLRKRPEAEERPNVRCEPVRRSRNSPAGVGGGVRRSRNGKACGRLVVPGGGQATCNTVTVMLAYAVSAAVRRRYLA